MSKNLTISVRLTEEERESIEIYCQNLIGQCLG